MLDFSLDLAASTGVTSAGGAGSMFAARAFSTLLLCLSASGASPTNLEVLIRNRRDGLADLAFHISPYCTPTSTPFLSNVTSLLLSINLDINLPTSRLFRVDDTGNADPSRPSFALESFLSHTTSLQHLRLNFQETYARSNTLFLRRLSTSPRSTLPHLSRLDIGMLDGFVSEVLANLVSRFGPTLKTLSFWKVMLRDTPAQQTALASDPEAEPNRWAELLTEVRRKAPGLEEIGVGWLRQLCKGGRQNVAERVRVQRARAPPGILDERPINEKFGREDMKDLKAFSELLAERLTVLWPEHESDEQSDWSGSEEGSEDEEEDDGA
jgi:hypothetical protein